MSELAVANLSLIEGNRLVVLEDVIDQGRQTFIDVGNALLEIRELRLYRESHGTFEDYCRGRWEFTAERARQFIQAARVVSAIPTTVGIPTNESQARELAPLLDDPEQLREAWTEANKNGHATAATVRQAVAIRRPLDQDIVEQQQRDTAVELIDRCVFALEANVDDIPTKLDWILETRDLVGGFGPLTPARFERAAAYCAAFATELRERGITDGQG